MTQTERMKCFFDERAAHWDARGHADNTALLRGILSAAGLTKDMRILDIACGTGVLFPLLFESDPELVHGIDLSDEMVKLARKKADDLRIEVFAVDFYGFSPACRYDFAVAYNAYPHFIDKKLFAKKLYALLEKGGRFLIVHGRGREMINAHHNQGEAVHVSVPLRPCDEEALAFEGLFRIDLKIDTESCYALSGTAL